MQPIRTTLFLDVLAQLEALPANDPVWQEVTIFVAELCRLHEEALTRAAAHTLREQQDQLAQAATAIFRRYAETLKPFEVGPADAVILNLDAGQGSLEAAQQDIATLERALTEYAALAHMERDTITQRRNIRNKEERLEHEIEDMLAQLRHWCSLVASADPPVGPFSLNTELGIKSSHAASLTESPRDTTALMAPEVTGPSITPELVPPEQWLAAVAAESRDASNTAANEDAGAESASIFVAELTAALDDALTTALANAVDNAVDNAVAAEAVPVIEFEPHDELSRRIALVRGCTAHLHARVRKHIALLSRHGLGDGSELTEPHETGNDGARQQRRDRNDYGAGR